MSQTIHQPKVLFLDFDGVLHPDAVFLTRKGPTLRVEGELFMWAPNLAEVLLDFPKVRVVLSTSWVRHLGFKRALSYLPEVIKKRVVGATWHSDMAKGWADQNWWDSATRYEQICRFAGRAHVPDWIAIDDDPEGWPAEAMSRLVCCDSQLGLAQDGRIETLRSHLSGAPC